MSGFDISTKKCENVEQGEYFLQQYHKYGLGYDKCVKGYDTAEAAATYHGLDDFIQYEGPEIMANMLAGLIPDIVHAKILDLAAGPGLIGKRLYDRGFRNIDAHDGAAAMVDFCRTTPYYKDFYTCFVGDGNPLPMADNTYDGIACSGSTVSNHLPPSSQLEVARVIKPGGFFVNSYRANLYETEVEYANEWRQVAEKMVEEGKWELYGVLNFEKYCKMSTGRMDIYKILG